MTVVPGFTDCHNHAPGNTLLYEVLVGNPFEVEFVTIASIVDKLRAKAQQTPPGDLGRRLFLRRHQGEGQAAAERPRPGPGLDRPSGRRPPSRRPHVVLQQQGARDGRRHEGTRRILPGGTFDRDASGELNGRVTDRARAAFDKVGTRADVHRRRRRRSATATASRTSRSSSSATA